MRFAQRLLIMLALMLALMLGYVALFVLAVVFLFSPRTCFRLLERFKFNVDAARKALELSEQQDEEERRQNSSEYPREE